MNIKEFLEEYVCSDCREDARKELKEILEEKYSEIELHMVGINYDNFSLFGLLSKIKSIVEK